MAEGKDIAILASSLSSVFVRQALEGLESALAGSGHKLDLIEVDLSEANEAKIAGLMYVHMPMNVRQIALFRESRIPVAYLAGRMEGIDWCMVDEAKGAYEATRHLIALGHKRIALV